MSYRKITVGDTEYEYVVGRSHVKVKGIGVWSKETVGKFVVKSCGCCGEPLNSIYDEEKLCDSDYAIRVTPADIVNKIKRTISVGVV